MFRLIWNIFYTKGVINLGNGNINAKRNNLTGAITLLLSKDTTDQMFTEVTDGS